MSRARAPSERFRAQIAVRSAGQAQASATVMQASNTAAAMEATEAVATDLATSVAAINDVLNDYGDRIANLEAP